MRKHLLLTCLAYMANGAGLTISIIGHAAGMKPFVPIVILFCCQAFFLAVVFTSMQKLKRKLFHEDGDVDTEHSGTTHTSHDQQNN